MAEITTIAAATHSSPAIRLAPTARGRAIAGISLVLACSALAAWPSLSLRGPIGGSLVTVGGGSRGVTVRISEEPLRIVRTRVTGPLERMRVLDGAGVELALLHHSDMELSFQSGSDGTVVYEIDMPPGSVDELRLAMVAQPALFLALCRWAPLGAALGTLLLVSALRRRSGAPPGATR